MTTSVTITAAGVTHIGGANNRENQDEFFVKTAIGRFAVFDGHGAAGRMAANFASAFFEEVRITGPGDIPRLFRAAEDALRSRIPERGQGGTTASVLLLNKDSGAATVAHVGDSEIRYYDSGSYVRQGHPVTRDHSTSSLSEFKRMHAESGHVPNVTFKTRYKTQPTRSAFTRNPVTDEWEPNPLPGYMTYNIRNDIACYLRRQDGGESLAMTRSIGDFTMKVDRQVTCIPDVIQLPPPPPGVTRTFIVATDGLWDVVHPDDIRDVIDDRYYGDSADTIAEHLLLMARNKGLRMFGVGADNVTIIVVRLIVGATPTTTPGASPTTTPGATPTTTPTTTPGDAPTTV